MIAAAERVVLLADAEKFAMTSRVRVCDADAIDALVTDAELPAVLRAVLDDAGIDVTVAAPAR
jgi:DeoR/GlpR family transcriptional regulator of sugar metabolism